MNEMTKLAILLAKNDIPFELVGMRSMSDDMTTFNKPVVQIVSPSIADRKMDAVCHKCSYGGEEGLLEIMVEDPAFEKENCDSVVGWLTAEEAFPYFERWSK